MTKGCAQVCRALRGSSPPGFSARSPTVLVRIRAEMRKWRESRRETLDPGRTGVGSVAGVTVALPDRLAERLVRCVVGLFCFGLGISCFIAAGLGLAPWDVLHQGLSEH